MKKYVVFTAVFLFLNALLSAELTKAQLWAISLTGIMTEVNRSYRNTLNTLALDERGINNNRGTLSRDWEITTREGLLENLDILERGGHAASFREIQEIVFEINKAATEYEVINILNRNTWDQTKLNRFNYIWNNWGQYQSRTIKAWDLGRSISLCRWGYGAGFITEDEAWERIVYIAKLIQPLYNSWEEYGYDYFMGRLFWASGSRSEESYLAATEPIYRKLLDSYWSWLKWDIDLDEPEPTALPVNTRRFFEPDDNDGVLQFRTVDPDMYDKWIWNSLPNHNSDPNIYEGRVKKISGNDDYGFGIVFCVDDTDRNDVMFYRIFISVNGRFTIGKRTKNTYTSLVSWRDSSFLYTGFNVYNTLRVERTDYENGVAFRLFINGNLAAAFNDDNPVNGSKAGLAVSVNVMEKEQFPHIPVDVRLDY